MSGPKTSELEIEQRRHALMEELRTRATDARAHAIRMIEEACRHAEEAAAAAGREELAHEAADVAARAADEVQRQTRFEVGADLEAARAAVEELTRAAEKTASTARARLEVIVDDARTAASRQTLSRMPPSNAISWRTAPAEDPRAKPQRRSQQHPIRTRPIRQTAVSAMKSPTTTHTETRRQRLRPCASACGAS